MPMTVMTTEAYTTKIKRALSYCVTQTDLDIGKKYEGKVRDTYDLGDKLILITTDRQSAFDRVLAAVPFKGQVLNLSSAWWFEQTSHIIPNHVIAIPDANVTIAKKCQVFPIEFVVRGYITGTTNTSLWTQYDNGVRQYCGNLLPDGLRKNQRLEAPLLTPTTKDIHHDRPISPEEIIREGWMTQTDWEIAANQAMRLYEYGVAVAKKHGLILVDTKYEMGKDAAGNIVLVDELHTPDSSRYWLAKTYEERYAQALEPDNIDKEFLRRWFIEHCRPYEDSILPTAPDALIIELSRRYIQLYEMMTASQCHFPDTLVPVEERIKRAIASYLV